MRIIVPIKQVPETSNVKMDPVTGVMIRKGLEAIINPLDLYAIEMALRIKETHGGEIITLTMGPPQAEKALREAIAMGCDKGILVSDKKFGGADTFATGYTLMKAIKKIGFFDLILCGERAIDGDTGQVGPAIASFLGLPLVTYVIKVYDLSEDHMRLERLVEGGKEYLTASFPILLTVLKEIANPRLPTLRGMQKAKRADIPLWGPEDIKAEEQNIGLLGSATRVVKIEKSQIARKGVFFEVKDELDNDKAVEQLVLFLKQKNLL